MSHTFQERDGYALVFAPQARQWWILTGSGAVSERQIAYRSPNYSDAKKLFMVMAPRKSKNPKARKR